MPFVIMDEESGRRFSFPDDATEAEIDAFVGEFNDRRREGILEPFTIDEALRSQGKAGTSKPLAARITGSIAGGLTGGRIAAGIAPTPLSIAAGTLIGSVIGAGGGDIAAQNIEIAEGTRAEFNPLRTGAEVLSEATANLVFGPGAGARRLVPALKNILKGSVLGFAVTGVTNIAEGQPVTENLAAGTLIGGAAAGVLGAIVPAARSRSAAGGAGGAGAGPNIPVGGALNPAAQRQAAQALPTGETGDVIQPDGSIAAVPRGSVAPGAAVIGAGGEMNILAGGPPRPPAPSGRLSPVGLGPTPQQTARAARLSATAQLGQQIELGLMPEVAGLPPETRRLFTIETPLVDARTTIQEALPFRRTLAEATSEAERRAAVAAREAELPEPVDALDALRRRMGAEATVAGIPPEARRLRQEQLTAGLEGAMAAINRPRLVAPGAAEPGAAGILLPPGARFELGRATQAATRILRRELGGSERAIELATAEAAQRVEQRPEFSSFDFAELERLSRLKGEQAAIARGRISDIQDEIGLLRTEVSARNAAGLPTLALRQQIEQLLAAAPRRPAALLSFRRGVSAPEQPVGPARPEAPVTAARPAQPLTLPQPARAIPPARPTQPLTPARPEQPIEPARPEVPVPPARPEAPIPPARPEQLIAPARPETAAAPSRSTELLNAVPERRLGRAQPERPMRQAPFRRRVARVGERKLAEAAAAAPDPVTVPVTAAAQLARGTGAGLEAIRDRIDMLERAAASPELRARITKASRREPVPAETAGGGFADAVRLGAMQEGATSEALEAERGLFAPPGGKPIEAFVETPDFRFPPEVEPPMSQTASLERQLNDGGLRAETPNVPAAGEPGGRALRELDALYKELFVQTEGDMGRALIRVKAMAREQGIKLDDIATLGIEDQFKAVTERLAQRAAAVGTRQVAAAVKEDQLAADALTAAELVRRNAARDPLTAQLQAGAAELTEELSALGQAPARSFEALVNAIPDAARARMEAILTRSTAAAEPGGVTAAGGFGEISQALDAQVAAMPRAKQAAGKQAAALLKAMLRRNVKTRAARARSANPISIFGDETGSSLLLGDIARHIFIGGRKAVALAAGLIARQQALVRAAGTGLDDRLLRAANFMLQGGQRLRFPKEINTLLVEARMDGQMRIGPLLDGFADVARRMTGAEIKLTREVFAEAAESSPDARVVRQALQNAGGRRAAELGDAYDRLIKGGHAEARASGMDPGTIAAYFPRQPTQFLLTALKLPKSAEGQALAKVIGHEITLSQESEEAFFRAASSGDLLMNAPAGHLEYERMLRDVPLKIPDLNGRMVELFHTDPFQMVPIYAEQLARRIGLVNTFKSKDIPRALSESLLPILKAKIPDPKRYDAAVTALANIAADMQGIPASDFTTRFHNHLRPAITLLNAGLLSGATIPNAIVGPLPAFAIGGIRLGARIYAQVMRNTLAELSANGVENTIGKLGFSAADDMAAAVRRFGNKDGVGDALKVARELMLYSENATASQIFFEGDRGLARLGEGKIARGAEKAAAFSAKATLFDFVNREINKAAALTGAEAITRAREKALSGGGKLDFERLIDFGEFTPEQATRILRSGVTLKDAARMGALFSSRSNAFRQFSLDNPRLFKFPAVRAALAFTSIYRSLGLVVGFALKRAIKDGDVAPLLRLSALPVAAFSAEKARDFLTGRDEETGESNAVIMFRAILQSYGGLFGATFGTPLTYPFLRKRTGGPAELAGRQLIPPYFRAFDKFINATLDVAMGDPEAALKKLRSVVPILDIITVTLGATPRGAAEGSSDFDLEQARERRRQRRETSPTPFTMRRR